MSSPAGRADDPAGGVAVRVVIAEDSVLLREGLAGLLARFGFDGGRRGRRRRRAARRRRARPRPTSSSPTCACRRASPTRGCGPPWPCAPPTPAWPWWRSASTCSTATPANCSARGDGPRDRLSAQGPGGRRRGVRRRAAPGRRRRHGRRPRGGAPADAAPPRPARRTCRRANARCWRWSPRATRTRRSPAILALTEAGGRQAHRQPPRQAAPAAQRRHEPPGPRRSHLPTGSTVKRLAVLAAALVVAFVLAPATTGGQRVDHRPRRARASHRGLP